VTGLAAGNTFPAQPASGWTRTATTILPGTQTGDVALTVKAGWSDYPGPLTGTAKVTLAGGCKPADPPPPPAPEKPVMTASAVCTSGAQIVTWMVKNPEAGGGRNMTLTAVSAGSVKVTGLAVNDVLTPGSSKTGTSTLPGDRTDPVILNVTATWTGFADPLSNSVTATLGGNCVQETTTTIRTTEITSAPTTTTTTAPTTTTTAAPTTTTTVKTDVLSQTEKAPTTTTTVKTEVLGEQVTKPAPGGPLAHTGAAIGLLAFIGGGLLWIGLPLSRYKRRKNED
jgi:hypothetical protein